MYLLIILSYDINTPNIYNFTSFSCSSLFQANEELRYELFGPLRPISHDTYKEIYTTTGIDLDDRKKDIANCVSHGDQEVLPFVKFAKAIPGFKDINVEDQLLLLKGIIYKLA